MDNEIKIDENMTFEKASELLNGIVRKLSEGNVTLDESLQLFKTGTALVAFCNDKLNEVKQQIEIINTQTGDADPADL
ncbi:MAG: exodeoxyribonuclease VII small subunit [Clostridiales bacterium]|nr:exodeoxyribonuclease VII small subunit [Clostridiales bacterium]